MVIPVGEHRLIKIRKSNRRRLIRYALLSSILACIGNITGSMTDNWLYTQEVLKYFVLPNSTNQMEEHAVTQEVFLKTATLGPWNFCWADPVTAVVCEAVFYSRDDDPADVTSGVQQGVRRAFVFMVSGIVLDVLGVVACVVCNLRPNTYSTLFISTVLHILAGLANFACIIVYMSAVSKEVGNKIYPASEMDEPLFHYQYGYSFIMLKVSFLLTEFAALFSVVVFMAKRDERTFHRFKIRSILSSALSPRKTANGNGEFSPNARFSPTHSSTQSTLPPTPSTDQEENVVFF